MSDLPYQTEYAKSSRAKCKGCKETIDQGKVRIAAMVQSAFFDGKQANWYHEDCFFKKQRPKTADEISKLNTLRNADRKRIIEKIDQIGTGAVLQEEKKGPKSKRKIKVALGAIQDFAVEYSKSSRATCRVCDIKICKDEVRVCKIVFDTEVGQKFGGQPLWHHVKCFAEDRKDLLFLASGELLPGFNSLSNEDKNFVKKQLPALNEDEIPNKKIKKEPVDDDEIEKEKSLDVKIESQNKLFFKYKDALRKYAKRDIHELLEANAQEIPTGTDTCLDILADAMAFGALQPCAKCKNGQLYLDTHGYVCHGDMSEWTKCQNITQSPERVPFKVPKSYKDAAPFKKFKPKVDVRIFKSVKIVESQNSLTIKKESKSTPPLKNLNFFIYGKTKNSKDELKNRVLKLGGNVVSKFNEQVAAVISTKKEVEKMSLKMQEVNEKDVEVVEESYLDLIDKDTGNITTSLNLIKENNIAPWGSDPMKRVPQDVIDGKSIPKSKSLYIKSEKSGSKKLKLKGGTAVDPDSGLEDIAHVYTDSNGLKWTVVLGLTDVVAQKNSYYKLQLLQSDSGNKFWLFRSWGRIGTTIGGNKTENCKSLMDAKSKFEELYTDKTDNIFDFPGSFVKAPGKMYPIDIDYGSDDNVGPMKEDENCVLPIAVQRLVIKIFDINLMKKALLEFELDTEKMPLGKLSKIQIKSGFSVLSELTKLINNEKKKKNVDKIIDATNRFYTLIPHNFGVANPPLLDNTEILKTKTDMLDSLLEIEIAYSLLKSESGTTSSPVEAHYLKLKTEITPIDTDGPEFEMLQKYVKNTHAKTHSQYTLEIQQIFRVVRHGEEKRYKPFRKLHNRRLLWHGSRTTNFAGILSQGLRIAPPEAPVTGYMFGKGIYFADMVSKSANYCATSKSNPIGIMMLSEVALGNMKECYQAEMVTSLPTDKHSVWGVGRTLPNPEENLILDDKTIVPLGTPIEQKIDTSLLYNEFIVYDVAQVNVKYLFQMKFNYLY